MTENLLQSIKNKILQLRDGCGYLHDLDSALQEMNDVQGTALYQIINKAFEAGELHGTTNNKGVFKVRTSW